MKKIQENNVVLKNRENRIVNLTSWFESNRELSESLHAYSLPLISYVNQREEEREKKRCMKLSQKTQSFKFKSRWA